MTSKSILLFILLAANNSLFSQHAHTSIKSIAPLYHSNDTVANSDYNTLTLEITWMDSLLVITKTPYVKYNLEYMRKFRKDSLYVPSVADTLRMNDMRRTGSQNCHSYALERYFLNKGIEDGALFTSITSVTENRYMENVLVTAFHKTISFPVKRKKCKECSFQRGSLIVLRNKWSIPIHTAYFDGVFHTKNGALPIKSVSSINNIIATYWDTTTIEAYELDVEKINAFLVKKEIKN